LKEINLKVCEFLKFFKFKILVFSIGPPGWHSLVLKLRADSLDLVLNSKTIFWVQGNQARQIGAGKQKIFSNFFD